MRKLLQYLPLLIPVIAGLIMVKIVLGQDTTIQPANTTIIKDSVTYTLQPRLTPNKLEQGFYIKGIIEKVYLVKSGDKYAITDGKKILKTVVVKAEDK